MIHNLVLDRPYEHLLRVWQDILDKTPDIDGQRLFIRKAIAEDALLLDIRDEQAETFDSTNIDYVIRMHAWLNMLTPMNYTVFYGNDVLLMITIMPISHTVAEISFLVDKKFIAASKKVKFHMIKAFKEALIALPFPRIQGVVKKSFGIGNTFVQKLGFTEEGTLRNYGINGEDYTMYSLI